MTLFGGINPYESQRFGFGYIDTIQKQRAVTASFKGLPVSNQREQMDDTTRDVLRLRKALEAVKQLVPETLATTEIDVSVPAKATSASNLDVSSITPGTPTTLESTEEVNASTTSYSTGRPAIMRNRPRGAALRPLNPRSAANTTAPTAPTRSPSKLRKGAPSAGITSR